MFFSISSVTVDMWRWLLTTDMKKQMMNDVSIAHPNSTALKTWYHFFVNVNDFYHTFTEEIKVSSFIVLSLTAFFHKTFIHAAIVVVEVTNWKIAHCFWIWPWLLHRHHLHHGICQEGTWGGISINTEKADISPLTLKSRLTTTSVMTLISEMSLTSDLTLFSKMFLYLWPDHDLGTSLTCDLTLTSDLTMILELSFSAEHTY